MKIFRTFSCIIFVTIFVGGCADSNPLIGKWSLKPGQENTAFALCKTLLFEDDLYACGGLAEKATYDIKDNRVIVHGKTGISFIIFVKDQNTLVTEGFGMGTTTYGRSSY